MSCHYCGWHDNRHDPNCPKPSTPAMERWGQGWNDGRKGKPKASNDVHYLMGWMRGEVALETAQNESRPGED